MQFRSTPLQGAFVVAIEPNEDERGFFARTWCEKEFVSHGLPGRMVQASISQNRRRGTVRGMHLQLPPSQEGKLVRCLRGAIHDVIIDLRPESDTYLQHFGCRLSATDRDALFIPARMAHGFQTLSDDCEVLYLMTDFYQAGLGFGIRWNDPAFGISWPMSSEVVLLDRDAAYPDFDPATYADRLRDAGNRAPA